MRLLHATDSGYSDVHEVCRRWRWKKGFFELLCFLLIRCCEAIEGIGVGTDSMYFFTFHIVFLSAFSTKFLQVFCFAFFMSPKYCCCLFFYSSLSLLSLDL